MIFEAGFFLFFAGKPGPERRGEQGYPGGDQWQSGGPGRKSAEAGQRGRGLGATEGHRVDRRRNRHPADAAC